MEACRELSALGSEAVLLKGGHAEGAVCRDVLYHDGRFTVMEHPGCPSGPWRRLHARRLARGQPGEGALASMRR